MAQLNYPPHLSRVVLVVAIGLQSGWIDASASEQSAPRCEAQLHDSGVEPYGRIFSASTGQEIILPDFRLRVTGHTNAGRTLQLRRADSTERLVTVPEHHKGAAPYEFDFDGRRYVVEVNRSILARRALERDELVIWPREEYLGAVAVQ